MNRRSFLQAFSGSIAVIWVAIVAIPGVSYVMATIRRQQPQVTQFKRVARLADLPVGRPLSVAITGARTDAWTTYPNEPLGEIWLIRRDSQTEDPSKSQIDAFSSVCPHLRCRIQLEAPQKQFVCPCHRGAFDLEGQPISKEQLGHQNPAPGPLETFAVKVIPDNKNDWWVEIEYPT